MTEKNAAVKAVMNRPPSATRRQVMELNREICNDINDCWRRSGEYYPLFEDLFFGVIDSIRDNVRKMKHLVSRMRDEEAERPRQAVRAVGGGGGGARQGGGGYVDQSYHQHQHLHLHQAPFPGRHAGHARRNCSDDAIVETRVVRGVLRDIYEGPRGGLYYISSSGDKHYV